MKETRHKNQQRSKKNTYNIFLSKKLRLIEAPYSEKDILQLHQAFLTPGFHYFHVLDVDAGRLFMQQFLSSLDYYKNIGYLTAINGVEQKFRDILEELQENGFLYEPYFLDEFFIDSFDYDFIWVEITAQLYAMPWYLEFYNRLMEYNIPIHIPIVMLSYGNHSIN